MSILIIAPKFYNYHKEIRDELLKYHQYVVLFNEIPFVSIGLFIRICSITPFISNLLWKCYAKRLKTVIHKKHIDTVFIIRGYFIPSFILDILKQDYPHIRIVYYQWDSVKNNPNSLSVSKYASKSFTFDFEDSISYSDIFTYLPLYYNWKQDGNEEFCISTDILVVASWSKYRSEYVKTIKERYQNLNLRWTVFFYMPIMTYFKWLIKGQYHIIKEANYIPISKNKYYHLLQHSKAVLDIPSPSQSGASIRVIEALSLQKKIITTNKNLSQAIIGAESPNILFYEEIGLLEDFLSAPFVIEDNISETVMSLNEWLNKIGLL